MNRILISLVLFFFTVSIQAQFLVRDGNKIRKGQDGSEVHLRGMSFGNLVWIDREIPDVHHNESDYARLKELGMNAIRFYLNYKTFEDDSNPYVYKQTGWDWLDQNVAWAKSQGTYLILNMHVPQGGFQSQCEGEALWEVAENQKRLAALWKAIAERYKNETQIAAFDLLNEPTPKNSVQEWFTLADRLVDSVRVVDPNHLIITERAIAVNCDYGFNDGNYNYPPLTEENIMYTVHMYEPFEYTHQQMDWAGTGDGGSYPDENEHTFPSDITSATGNYNNPNVATGTSDWTAYKGSVYQVTGDSLIAGRLVFNGGKIGAGKVYFDDVIVEEVDALGNTIKVITEVNFAIDESPWFWSENNDGSITAETTTGHNDNFCYSITGTSGYATAGIVKYTFKAEKGKYYRASGWVKGENVPLGTVAAITTEYYYSPSGGKVTYRDYNALKTQILAYTKYLEDRGYPIYFGEFGAGRPCFENNKGGADWVSDVIKIFDEYGYHWTYHAYREGNFGYYETWDGPLDPSTENLQLREVFLDYFSGRLTNVTLIDKDSKLMFYPNPFKDVLHLDERVSSLEFYTLGGMKVLESKVEELNEVISSLDANIYIVRFYDVNGVLLGTEKVKKQ